jgi:hypothetical protein
VLLGLALEVSHVDAAMSNRSPCSMSANLARSIMSHIKHILSVHVSLDSDDVHPAHVGRRRVSAVRRLGDETDVPMALSAVSVVRRDSAEPCVLRCQEQVRTSHAAHVP